MYYYIYIYAIIWSRKNKSEFMHIHPSVCVSDGGLVADIQMQSLFEISKNDRMAKALRYHKLRLALPGNMPQI